MGRKPANECVNAGFVDSPPRLILTKTCQATNRNLIRGRRFQGECAIQHKAKLEEWNVGRWGAWAGTVHALIWGDLPWRTRALVSNCG